MLRLVAAAVALVLMGAVWLGADSDEPSQSAAGDPQLINFAEAPADFADRIGAGGGESRAAGLPPPADRPGRPAVVATPALSPEGAAVWSAPAEFAPPE